jgi:outer membrane receptor for ferrienterochelin and colicin
LSYNVGLRLDYLTKFNITDVSPRLNLSYGLNKKLDLKFATGIFYQAPFVTELKNNPTLKSSQSNHYITGLTYKFSTKNTLGIEAYYKDYKNVIIFDSKRNFSNDGEGNAKGLEFFEQFNNKNITAKIGYTYALANRKRNLQPAIFPFYFEQKHRANLWVNFHPEKRLKKWLPFSYVMQFNYYTGTPYTPIVISESSNIIFGDINSVANPIYHNLNLKLMWKYKIGKKKQTDLTFFLEFWNLYNRKNFKERKYVLDASSSNKLLKAKDEFITPLLPNLGVKFYFN